MLETILLVLSVSIDSFLASIAYGTSKIKIPLTSAFIVDIISASMLGFSLLVGGFLQNYISANVARIISFLVLFLLGVYRLFESLLKSYIKNKSNNLSPLTILNYLILMLFCKYMLTKQKLTSINLKYLHQRKLYTLHLPYR